MSLLCWPSFLFSGVVPHSILDAAWINMERDNYAVDICREQRKLVRWAVITKIDTWCVAEPTGVRLRPSGRKWGGLVRPLASTLRFPFCALCQDDAVDSRRCFRCRVARVPHRGVWPFRGCASVLLVPFWRGSVVNGLSSRVGHLA